MREKKKNTEKTDTMHEIHIKANKIRKTTKEKWSGYYLNKEKGEEKENDSTEQKYIPWLLLKNSLGDTGLRPLDNPSWTPPSIWVETYQPNGFEGQIVTQPESGKSYQIAAEIHNIGLAPSWATIVEFYVNMPSPSQPQKYTLKPIGNPPGTSIQVGTSSIVRSSLWIPEFVGDGHECLIVRAYNPILDPIDPTSFNQVVDRHVGQKNIYIIYVSAGTHSFSTLFIWPSGKEVEGSKKIRLIVTPIDKSQLFSILNQLRLKGQIANWEPLYFGITTKEDLKNIEGADKLKKEKDLTLPIDIRFSKFARKVVEIYLKPKQKKEVFLVQAIPYNAKKGEILGLTVSQWVGDQLVGKINQITLVK